QVGRKKLPYRKFTACRDVKEVVGILESPGSRLAPSFFEEKNGVRGVEDNPVVFMFPGLGSQYVNMGLDIYNEEPVYRRAMDICFESLRSRMGIDLKRVLYPPEQEQPEAEQRIDRFDIAQLAVFTFEYALTHLLITWGITPAAMIGYSFGEYTAACAAGVFSLDDALELVVSRGRLIRRLPAGAMLS
ncbi:MAG: acyltransferase domain-containing protein, partial [bacterium]|nr:acyltransferase domain-containing protein [bacterium]